jgi:hypothetical protein
MAFEGVAAALILFHEPHRAYIVSLYMNISYQNDEIRSLKFLPLFHRTWPVLNNNYAPQRNAAPPKTAIPF